MSEAVAEPAPAAGVTTLELFFDLVFVFTITQLTSVLVHEPGWKGLLQVSLMLVGAGRRGEEGGPRTSPAAT